MCASTFHISHNKFYHSPHPHREFWRLAIIAGAADCGRAPAPRRVNTCCWWRKSAAATCCCAAAATPAHEQPLRLTPFPPCHPAAAQRAAGGSWTSVNLQGTLQERGSLAVDRWSERRYFSKGDCLHPAPPGLARLMAALKSRHFEPLRRRELRS